MNSQYLRQAAKISASSAYAPYSSFFVGAAVVFVERPDKVYVGCNVENKSFGLTICAERNAVCSGIIDGCREILKVAIAVKSVENSLFRGIPCGACLQFISEFASSETEILFNETESIKLDKLLPARF